MTSEFRRKGIQGWIENSASHLLRLDKITKRLSLVDCKLSFFCQKSFRNRVIILPSSSLCNSTFLELVTRPLIMPIYEWKCDSTFLWLMTTLSKMRQETFRLLHWNDNSIYGTSLRSWGKKHLYCICGLIVFEAQVA